MDHPRAFETYDTTITKIEMLTPRVKGFRFQLAPGKEIHLKAGQFVQVFIPTPEKVRRTSYSIASPPQETTHLDLCVTLVREGVSSPFLHHLVEGAKLQVMGPLGKFWMPDVPPRDTVFVATGSGIAPFRSMINDLIARNTPKNLTLVFGNRYEHDIIYRKEWERLADTHSNFRHLFTLSKADSNWTGKRGYVQDAVADLGPDLASKDFYICGLAKMIEGVSTKLLSLGVPKEQIHWERYD